jgi:hypothetical protein
MRGPYTNILADEPVDNIYFIEYGYNQDFNIFLLALSHLLHTCCCPQVVLRECLCGGGPLGCALLKEAGLGRDNSHDSKSLYSIFPTLRSKIIYQQYLQGGIWSLQDLYWSHIFSEQSSSKICSTSSNPPSQSAQALCSAHEMTSSPGSRFASPGVSF